ncbi:hypothetical protein Cob_v011192 [Colletotrichum orbiculare MAFF 240422]|uniref:Uncharacterized protein n=1 Tax=Colletotrichum orbiculare (strain 104-T / ATCC 96160 / CBS 514.97 / LARS 414 / MAFF 240422) TaxID=1213857 RepID=A0A484FEF9_COLOR|nr:hypothetical protein Cob_v011192 [Colletotrichum orbiculare MAFF 240422]
MSGLKVRVSLAPVMGTDTAGILIWFDSQGSGPRVMTSQVYDTLLPRSPEKLQGSHFFFFSGLVQCLGLSCVALMMATHKLHPSYSFASIDESCYRLRTTVSNRVDRANRNDGLWPIVPGLKECGRPVQPF